MSLSTEAITSIKSTIDSATADPNTSIPGTVFCAVGKDGKELFSHASGKRSLNSSEPMTLETIFWIASCTKMIGGIACMQLVEQGKLSLDDADLAEKICPEFKNVKIVKKDESGKITFVEKKNRITLRMLLSHTAGFGYAFFNPELKSWSMPVGLNEFSGRPGDILTSPLLFEPGTNWNYGVNIDWAGVMVERVSNLSLNDYFQKNIFAPLNLKNISMFPNQSMKKNIAGMHYRDPSGKLQERDHLQRVPLVASEVEVKDIFNSAGAGCFATPVEYCQILATLLNNGTSPTTGATILKPETVEEMFKNQIPDMPNFARQGITNPKPELTNPIPELYPQENNPPQGWGLTFMLTIDEGATGRKRNTAWWAGLPNLFWWVDREAGVAGMICSQILPFADMKVMGLWGAVEAGVYSGLSN